MFVFSKKASVISERDGLKGEKCSRDHHPKKNNGNVNKTYLRVNDKTFAERMIVIGGVHTRSGEGGGLRDKRVSATFV